MSLFQLIILLHAVLSAITATAELLVKTLPHDVVLLALTPMLVEFLYKCRLNRCQTPILASLFGLCVTLLLCHSVFVESYAHRVISFINLLDYFEIFYYIIDNFHYTIIIIIIIIKLLIINLV